MLAAGIGYSFKCLRDAAVVSTAIAADPDITVIVNTPPRDPCTERIIATIWRCIIRWRRRYCPIGLSIGETTAGVVLRLDRKHRIPADEVRSFRFDLCRNFKLGASKFLDLKLV